MEEFEKKLNNIINNAIQSKVFPGAIFLILKNNKIIFNKAFGRFTYDLDSPLAMQDTIYDIASITKIIVATGALKLLERGEINLEQPIKKYLPTLKFSPVGEKNIKNLLTHTSGIHLGIEMSKLTKKLDELLISYLPNLKNVSGVDVKVEYGNINTYLLGEIIKSVSNKPLKKFLFEEIFTSLKMENTFFCPSVSMRTKIPPTEILNDGTIIQGIVHDESARIMGGETGHAGLFSNSFDLAKFVSFWLNNDSRILKPETLDFATKNHTVGFNLPSGLGWHLDNKEYLGNSFFPNTFFHPGFTGTIVGGNRNINLGFVFLSNCTYPHREGNKLKNEVFRSVFNEVFGFYKKY